MTKLFNRVGRAMPGRSVFNLSYEKKFSCDMGSLIPVLCEEAVPGDIWDIGGSAVIRFQPLVAPVNDEVAGRKYIQVMRSVEQPFREEYGLYYIGEFDFVNGELIQSEPPRLIPVVIPENTGNIVRRHDIRDDVSKEVVE